MGDVETGETEVSRVESLESQLDAVRAIGEALASSVGLDALFQRVVPNVSRLMNAERSTLFLYDDKSREIWSKVAEGEGGREIRLRLGAGVAGYVAQTRERVNITDAYRDPRFNRMVDARTGYRTETIAAAPIIDKSGNLVGVLQVLNHHEGRFSDEDISLLDTIAVQMAYAVENARQAQTLLDQNQELEAARHRAERRRAELDLLYQLEQETTASRDLDSLLDSVIIRACERLRSEAGSVLLLDRDSGRLFFRGVTGDRKDELRQVSLDEGEGVVGWVASSGEPAIVNRPEDDPRHDLTLAQRISYPARALLAVPLIWEGEVIGAMEVLNPTQRPTGAAGYDDEDLKVLTVIAGQVSRAVAVTRGHQERVETERLAFIGRMLAGVAHDLRNPMTVVSGYAQIMAVEDDTEERSRRCERILGQIDEMTAMVGDLLAFARGDTELRPSAVKLAELGEEIREALDLHCTPRGIGLDVDIEPATVWLDLGRVKRIIFNLAKNALDALTRGGAIEIRLAPMDDGVTIEVRDNGPGIPSEIRARIFEPFATSGKAGGTGLGLSIVKRFVEDHGGTISVVSEPGKGTAVSMVLASAHPNPSGEEATGEPGAHA